MSRWLADELHVALAPGRVGVAQVRCALGLKGMQREVTDRYSVACDPDMLAWDSALQAMDTLLPRYAKDRPNVIVVLSNHFVRYALVPWSDLIASDEQQRAYVRHCFKTTYGETAENWALRLSRSAVGAPQLASAVDEQLLTACHEKVSRHGLRLTSVQPYLMSAFNRFKDNIQQTDAWFALAEPGSICLARLHRGKWIRFRAARLGNEWGDFARFLVREAFLAGHEFQEEEQTLYVYAPHLGPLQAISGWQIHELPPPMPSSLAAETDTSLVMALSG